MKDEYRIAFVGSATGALMGWIKPFGLIQVIERPEVIAGTEIFLVDCVFLEHDLQAGWINDILDAGQSLGLLDMTQVDREALGAVVGRGFSDSIEHLLVKRLASGEHKYTIIPSLDRLAALSGNNDVEYLRTRVLPRRKTVPHYSKFLTQNHLWPWGEKLSDLCGSIQDVSSGFQGAPYKNSMGDLGIVQSVNISAKAYVSVSNGKGPKGPNGDGKYHVFLLSQLDTEDMLYRNINFGYSLHVTPYRNGEVMTSGVQRQPSSPQPENTSSSNKYGHYIETEFALTTPGWYTLGHQPGGSQYSVGMQPIFKQLTDQAVFPNVGLYSVSMTDTDTAAGVRFATTPGVWDVDFERAAEIETVEPTPVAPAESVKQNGQFTTLNYFIFDRAPVKSKTYPVDFKMSLTLACTWGFTGPTTKIYTLPFTIDMIAATKLQPFT